MAVKPIPEGYRTVTPYLISPSAAKVLDFVKETFDAKETVRMPGPDGSSIAHAEFRIGDSIVMISDGGKEYPPMPTTLYVYVSDVDATYKRALKAGATSVKEPADQFYGDRSASVKDSGGNIWGIATHIEDVTPEEMDRRMKALKK
ncbi:VOC family protein [bacterium]|nr:VOC family protein [bacterium]MCI0605832.1 VOC family protein [bacterium]